ncbi:MAG TPA: dTDP-4-dehydrorhamnose reductase [Prolixibacteraceae bacterium]|nr:dTDP-4-dehydrorhamnose reductase [Prolixibacteraceae bacterium]
MKIIVTGSKGQLGRSIQELSSAYPDLTFVFTDIEELDICDTVQVNNFFTAENPAVVINCAAYTAVDKAEKEVVLAEKINHHAVANLAVACKKAGARLIHISTDYLFDGSKSSPYHEKDIVKPRSVYGITKLEGETAILRSEVKAIIIRTSWLYSEYGTNFVKTMLRLGRERDQLSVVSDQTGTPTYAGDLAKLLLDIIRKTSSDSSAFVPGIYHYSNEGVASWYDFTKAIFEYQQDINCKVNPIDTLSYPTPAVRPAYSVLNKSKIKTTFGVGIPYWRDSLRLCLVKLSEKENRRS